MSCVDSDTDDGRSLYGDRPLSRSTDATPSLVFIAGRWRYNDIAALEDLDEVIVEQSRSSYLADFLEPYDSDREAGYAQSYASTVSI
jgi:hypothetical protein